MISAPVAKKLFPIAVFLLFGVLSVFLWQDQRRHEHEVVLRHTEMSAEQTRIRVEGLINSRIASLELMADRWVERQPADFSRERFLSFAEILYRRYPGYLAILWIDPAGVIQWAYPENPSRPAGRRNLSEYPDPSYAEAVRSTAGSAGLMVMPCVPLYQGGIGFHVLRVLSHDNDFQGYLDGVFKVEQIMTTSLTSELLNDFRVKIYEGDLLIYDHGYPGAPETGKEDAAASTGALAVAREIRFAGKSWRLRLEPSPVSHPQKSLGDLSFLLFGLALSAALSLSLFLLMQRMEMLGVSRDQALREVGERKRAQDALRENEKKLEALLSELTAKNVELESFVYTVSHDLKTPIVTIEGFIGALREDFGEQITPVGERYLRYMSDAARKMEVLINDLLNLSRIGRLTEARKEFSLDEPVEDALVTLQPQIDARGIEVCAQRGLPLVYGERKRIGQVMDNLLANAVKYIGKDNPSPRIDVGFEVRDGENVFFVRDNGIGIDPKYFDKIFQIFERLPSAKLAGEGTGVGLTIVRRIIDHHDGRIWLESEPGKGTTFFFTLKHKEAV